MSWGSVPGPLTAQGFIFSCSCGERGGDYAWMFVCYTVHVFFKGTMATSSLLWIGEDPCEGFLNLSTRVTSYLQVGGQLHSIKVPPPQPSLKKPPSPPTHTHSHTKLALAVTETGLWDPLIWMDRVKARPTSSCSFLSNAMRTKARRVEDGGKSDAHLHFWSYVTQKYQILLRQRFVV